MTPEVALDFGAQAMSLGLRLSAPLLLTALIVGLAVGILQAATQINEMTLSFIPKLLAMMAVLAFAGPWMLRILVDFTRNLFLALPQLVVAG